MGNSIYSSRSITSCLSSFHNPTVAVSAEGGIQAMRVWVYNMRLFQKAEGKGNPSGKQDRNRTAAALRDAIDIEMPETSVQTENQLAAAPFPQVEREEAKRYDSKDEPNEADKAVSGHALPFAGLMFMAAGGIANVYVKAHWKQTESALQQNILEYHLQSIRLACFMGMLILAFPLLSYAVNNPASTGSATRTKQMIMNVGIGILIAYVISETVIALPGSYWTTALLYLTIGVVLIILMWLLVIGSKRLLLATPMTLAQPNPSLRYAKEDHDSIENCIEVAHKYKDIIPVNQRVKAYELLQSNSSRQKMFLAMDEDEQKNWLLDSSRLSHYT